METLAMLVRHLFEGGRGGFMKGKFLVRSQIVHSGQLVIDVAEAACMSHQEAAEFILKVVGCSDSLGGYDISGKGIPRPLGNNELCDLLVRCLECLENAKETNVEYEEVYEGVGFSHAQADEIVAKARETLDPYPETEAENFCAKLIPSAPTNSKPIASGKTNTIYSTSWLSIQQDAIAKFFNPRRNPDAKKEEVVEWVKSEASRAGVHDSDRMAAAIFTIIKPENHSPKKKRVTPID
ncbi:MAG: hypothetical protein HY849_07290 [Nitrosomonadales bacterium]|nr:hypothetical protein [Nitrosomonadales bacterium]